MITSSISPYGTAATPEAQQAATEITDKLASGEVGIFPGGLKNNRGEVVVPEGDPFKLGDPRLNTIDWLVELGDGRWLINRPLPPTCG